MTKLRTIITLQTFLIFESSNIISDARGVLIVNNFQ